jgi:protein SCO1/2
MISIGLVAVVFITACGGSDAPEEVTLSGYERTPEPTVGSITLPAANLDTSEFTFMAEPDQLLMVNFGYSSCPDICPTTLADTRIAFNQLGDRADEVDFAFVSIDPDRDTAEVLTSYVEAFLTDGIAIRTDDADELALAADAFGVTYFVGENEEGELEVAHTPNVFLVDDRGSIILTWPFGVPAADMASDLTILLDREQQT